MEESKLIEKSFINWIIAVLKENGKDYKQMILNLKEKNPKLGAYAEKEEPKIKGCLETYYSKTFQQDITDYCMEQDDPQAAAKAFFTAIKANPGIEPIEASTMKELKKLKKVK